MACAMGLALTWAQAMGQQPAALGCDMLGYINQRSAVFRNCTSGQQLTAYTSETTSIPIGPAVDWNQGRVFVMDVDKGPSVLQLGAPWQADYNATEPPVVVIKNSTLRGRRGVSCMVFDAANDRLLVYVRAQQGPGGTFFAISTAPGDGFGAMQVHAVLDVIDTDIMQMDMDSSGGLFFTDGRSLSRVRNGKIFEVAGSALPCPFKNDGTCYIRGLTVDTVGKRVIYFMEDQGALQSVIKASSLEGKPTVTLYRQVRTSSATAGSWSPRMGFDKEHRLLFSETYRSSGAQRDILQLPSVVDNVVACVGDESRGDDCSMTPGSPPEFQVVVTVDFDTAHHEGSIAVLPRAGPIWAPTPSPSPGSGPANAGRTPQLLSPPAMAVLACLAAMLLAL